MWIFAAPIDPQKQTDDFMGWFSSNSGLIIGSIIAAIVLVGLFKALPKWLFLVVGVGLLAVLLGVVGSK